MRFHPDRAVCPTRRAILASLIVSCGLGSGTNAVATPLRSGQQATYAVRPDHGGAQGARRGRFGSVRPVLARAGGPLRALRRLPRSRRLLAARERASLVGAAAPFGRRIDPTTAAVLRSYGLTPKSRLYRVADPGHLDWRAGVVRGNPKSVATIQDPYHPQPNPLHVLLAGADADPDALGVPRTIPGHTTAAKVGAGLNVAVHDPSGYASDRSVKYSIRVKDVLARGGRFYPDSSSVASLIQPLYITFAGAIPFRLEDGPKQPATR